MKLYDSTRAPNPRRVRVFLAEKGIEVPLVPVDLFKHEHRSEAFTRLNPRRQIPTLELDDGTVICETMAICRYFEALQPEPNLFGRTPLEQAMVEMWQRRVELELFMPVAQVLRHLNPAMAALEAPQVPEWGEVNKPKIIAFLEFLNTELAERAYVAGDRFTVADITAIVTIDFMRAIQTEVPEHLTHVHRWRDVVSQRPSMKA